MASLLSTTTDELDRGVRVKVGVSAASSAKDDMENQLLAELRTESEPHELGGVLVAAAADSAACLGFEPLGPNKLL